MDELKPYAVFAETVAAGSMSGAGRRLGMSASAVSQTLRALERQMGVTLLHRSTRKLTLTEAGERCYPHCLRLVEAARAAADSLVQARDAPSGELRVAAPVGFAAHIAQALAPVLAQAPGLRLRLLVDDAMIDLIDARIDIAVRVGQLADSNWIARPLCEIEMVLCAAPAYVERHGLPSMPADLPGFDWIAWARETQEAGEAAPTIALLLHGAGGEAQRVQVPVRIASNNHVALQQMCEQGLGIARLGYADVLAQLSRGTLVRLLPQWRFTPLPVVAVTPRREGEPAKVRVAVEALKRYFATLPGLAA
ncbi:DNA-binding transcriptional LysR family regulator [Pelomonas saccharophila]|uniref:DNA-binding transcriptional LysR family regulator n=1 Tax=Roseateles saccharophilus TaxID=304 RepID=A0ABU1YU44_ROSSA|nr:LysR family transcriptional regulator [Roseateles saccharophilus]MDR7271730.1 DNA-binding transcriptional LysR family regulator [Roseateles saccharophilus]